MEKSKRLVLRIDPDRLKLYKHAAYAMDQSMARFIRMTMDQACAQIAEKGQQARGRLSRSPLGRMTRAALAEDVAAVLYRGERPVAVRK